MEILIIWLFTILASLGIEISNELRIFKDVADAGYKIDTEGLSEFNEQLFPNETKIELLSILVPGINIFKVFQRTMQYNNARFVILDQLRVMNVLEEMSEIEKIEYMKNPTGLNTLALHSKVQKRLLDALVLKVDDGNISGEIFYETCGGGGDNLDITILDATGSVAKLSKKEQKKLIFKSWKPVIQKIKVDLREKLNEELKNKSDLDLNENDDKITKDNDNSNFDDTKMTLEELKLEKILLEKIILFGKLEKEQEERLQQEESIDSENNEGLHLRRNQ